MLLGIDPLLTPELLMILRAMGHGDEIAIVDANYPAKSNAKRLVRLDGADASQALDRDPLGAAARFVREGAGELHAGGRQAEGDPAGGRRLPDDRRPAFGASRPRSPGSSASPSTSAPRPASRIVATSDRRLYANIILTKGVIGADGKVVA